MSDWLTPEERGKHYPHASYDPRSWSDAAGRRAYVIGKLLLHAAEADRRIAERDDVIRELGRKLRELVIEIRELDDAMRERDDVIRELADALREFMPCSCGWCNNGPDERCPTSMTLARYDALQGGQA